MGLFDRVWKSWGNMYRGRSEDPEHQETADTAESENISRGWPTTEQQSAADAAEGQSINRYSSAQEGGEEGEDGPGEGGEGGAPEEVAE